MAVYNGVTGFPAGVDDDGGLSASGTRGQDGNVYEWDESAFDGVNNLSSENRAIRGAGWLSSEFFLRASHRSVNGPSSSLTDVGFRVASVGNIPEPSSTVLMLSAGVLSLLKRRRPAD